jgi:hypothetical protein
MQKKFKMEQKRSKYHKLYSLLREADDYFPIEDREEVLELVKELYKDNNIVQKDLDKNGKYGISYKTIHDDSRFSDNHTSFFSSKKKRDEVYDDWINGRNWDTELNTELFYPTPTPNVHKITKVFKEGKEIYEEK